MRARARTGLHRALYWGHLRAAALLLDGGAQLSVLDHRVRGGPAGGRSRPGCGAWGRGLTESFGSGLQGRPPADYARTAMRSARVAKA